MAVMAMLKFNEWVNRYLNTAIDYDGSSGAQCVDLCKCYLKEVHNVPQFSIGGSAMYYYLRFEQFAPLKGKFKRIKNTPDFVPLKGDIAVWNATKGGGHGHVAICTGEGDTKTFYSYDMNWNGKAMKKVKHDYSGFYGVLRPVDRSMIETAVFFPKCNAKETSLVDALRSVGAKSDFAYRKVVASENNISSYIGTAKQNTLMLALLKTGKLIKP
jgi:hypothetical protein